MMALFCSRMNFSNLQPLCSKMNRDIAYDTTPVRWMWYLKRQLVRGNNDNSSFDKLINDLGKLVDKKYTRDDKLDKLLK